MLKEQLRLSEEQIHRIFALLEIQYKQAGHWLTSRCHIHGGDNPGAFAFNVQTCSWKCFTKHCESEWGNSVVSLVCALQKCSYDDGLDWIMSNLGEVVKSKAIEKKIDKIYPEICLQRLFKTDFYLKRGFVQSTLDAFEHGQAESGDMIHRVVFPIRDTKGFIRGFSGRWSGNEIEKDGKRVCVNVNGKEVPKWKHTSFQKSEYIYHFNIAKDFCKDELIIVESIANAMRWWECGHKNVVAVLGSSLSINQAKLVLNSTKRVVLAFDNDEAGHKAAQKSNKLLEQYVNTSIIFPKGDKDWAESTNEETRQAHG